MSELGIFLYGLVVFVIVSAACALIVYGIIDERRDRRTLDAGPDAQPPEPAATAAPPVEPIAGAAGGRAPR